MKRYTKPELTEVKLTAEEQVLSFCKSWDENRCWEVWGQIPLQEIYGPAAH